MTEPTSGVWQADTRGSDGIDIYNGPEDTAEWIARVYDLDDEDGNDQTAANARLIAAAPQLLEACKVALAALGPLPSGMKWPPKLWASVAFVYHLLDETIARAEGKPKVE